MKRKENYEERNRGQHCLIYEERGLIFFPGKLKNKPIQFLDVIKSLTIHH